MGGESHCFGDYSHLSSTFPPILVLGAHSVAPTSLLVSLAHDLVLLLRRQGTDAKVKCGVVGLLEDLACPGLLIYPLVRLASRLLLVNSYILQPL